MLLRPLVYFLLGGCAQHYTSDTALMQPRPPEFFFVEVGRSEDGCTMFAKKPLKDGVMVDAAIWWQDSQGRFVLAKPAQCKKEKEAR